jgi:hypothetical protein
LRGRKNPPVAGSITFAGVSRMPAPVLQPCMNAVMYVNGFSVEPGELSEITLSLRPSMSSRK